MTDDTEYIELSMAGDRQVGKMSILTRWADDKFGTLDEDPIKSRCRKFGNLMMMVRAMCLPLSYNPLGSVLVIYDVTVPASFKYAIEFIQQKKQSIENRAVKYRWAHRACCTKELIEKCLVNDDLIYLIANKCDMSDRSVTTQDGLDHAKKLDVPYFEISAKTGAGFQELFADIIEKSKHRPLTMAVRHRGSTPEVPAILAKPLSRCIIS